MKAKNSLIILGIAVVFFLTSCKKDDSTLSPFTKDEAISTFTAIEGSYKDITIELDEATGPKVQSTLNSLGFPTIPLKVSQDRFEGIQNDPLESIQPTFAKETYDQDPFVEFSFNAYKGTWTYTSSWTKTSSEPTDKVVLVFPYGDGGTATMTYSEFQTKTIGGKLYTGHLNGELKISTQTNPIMTWIYEAVKDLKSKDYSFVYTFGSFTKTKSFSKYAEVDKLPVSKSNSSFSIDWKKNGETVYAKSVSAIFEYGPGEDYNTSYEGKIRVMDVVYLWNINFDQDTDQTYPNNYIKISVWKTNGAEVANIIFASAVKASYPLLIKFTDGSTSPIKDYLTSLGEYINEFTWFVRYFGVN